MLQNRGVRTARAVAREDLAKWSLDRISERSIPEPNTGCWLWTGYITTTGYGGIRVNDRQLLAHRVAYALAHGDLPEGADLLHACDQPACVNPGHLRAGTQAENNADTLKRNRHIGGLAGGAPKLTRDAVERIRFALSSGIRVADLARAQGVHRKTIERIRNRRTWTKTRGGETR